MDDVLKNLSKERKAELFQKHRLPMDFGPWHQEWKIPSRRARFQALLAEASEPRLSPSSNRLHGQMARQCVAQRPIVQKNHRGEPGSFPGSHPDIERSSRDVVVNGSMGVAVSTYFGPDTSERRHSIFVASIYSLLASEFPGKVVVVDDGSTTHRHLVEFENNPQLRIVYRRVNGGVSRCKNTGIKTLSGCDHLFLADDDMLYNGRWWEPYIIANVKTGIGHFSFRPPSAEFPWDNTDSESVDTTNGVPLRRVKQSNGCLQYFSKSAIAKLGGFKVLPYRFGFEHLDMEERAVRAGVSPPSCACAHRRRHRPAPSSSRPSWVRGAGSTCYCRGSRVPPRP